MHEPTTHNGTPTTCWLCGRRAGPVGISTEGDPHLLCDHCVPLVAQLRATTAFDVYEQNAIQVVIEQLGPVVEANGTDLADWSAEQVEEFVVAVILGFGSAIRQQVRDKAVPF